MYILYKCTSLQCYIKVASLQQRVCINQELRPLLCLQRVNSLGQVIDSLSQCSLCLCLIGAHIKRGRDCCRPKSVALRCLVQFPHRKRKLRVAVFNLCFAFWAQRTSTRTHGHAGAIKYEDAPGQAERGRLWLTDCLRPVCLPECLTDCQ